MNETLTQLHSRVNRIWHHWVSQLQPNVRCSQHLSVKSFLSHFASGIPSDSSILLCTCGFSGFNFIASNGFLEQYNHSISIKSVFVLFFFGKFYIRSFLDSGECCAARSVHLRFQPDVDECVDLFYNEVTVERTTPGSYFMICGWSCGYFGIQQLTEDMNHNNKVVLHILSLSSSEITFKHSDCAIFCLGSDQRRRS